MFAERCENLRHVFGAYLGALLEEARAGSAATLEHERARAVRVRDGLPAYDGTLVVVSHDRRFL